jgi:hypothetical protein
MNDLGKTFVLEHGNIPLSHVEQVVAHYVDGYNPAKAHEYYLRTRALKGKTPAGVKPVSKGRPAAVKPASKGKMPGAKKPAGLWGANAAAQKRKETEAKVAALKLRLEKLRIVLADLTTQAKARSGVEPVKDAKEKASGKKEGKGSSKLTPKQEQALKKWREDYEKKNKKEPTVDEQEAQLAKQVKDALDKIAYIRGSLKKPATSARKEASKTPAAKAADPKKGKST